MVGVSEELWQRPLVKREYKGHLADLSSHGLVNFLILRSSNRPRLSKSLASRAYASEILPRGRR